MKKKVQAALQLLSDALATREAPRAPDVLTSEAKRAKAFYGTTDNPAEAGYILPDGSWLDLSGSKRGMENFPYASARFPDMTFQGMPGTRNLPHASIGDVIEKAPSGMVGKFPGYGEAEDPVADFLERSGALRFDGDFGSLEGTRVPTRDQRYSAARALDEMYQSGNAEALDPDTMFYVGGQSFEVPSPGDIYKFFNRSLEQRGLNRESQALLSFLRQLEGPNARYLNPTTRDSLTRRIEEAVDKIPVRGGALQFLRE